MLDKSPESYGWITYGWVVGLSVMGGVAAFVSKVSKGKSRAFNITELVGEMTTSAFAGIMAFYLCQWSDFSQLLTAAVVGMSGHMGSRAIFIIEKCIASKIGVTQKVELDESNQA